MKTSPPRTNAALRRASCPVWRMSNVPPIAIRIVGGHRARGPWTLPSGSQASGRPGVSGETLKPISDQERLRITEFLYRGLASSRLDLERGYPSARACCAHLLLRF